MCVGFRGQGSMYQALVGHFAFIYLFIYLRVFVTIRIQNYYKKCLAE